MTTAKQAQRTPSDDYYDNPTPESAVRLAIADIRITNWEPSYIHQLNIAADRLASYRDLVAALREIAECGKDLYKGNHCAAIARAALAKAEAS